MPVYRFDAYIVAKDSDEARQIWESRSRHHAEPTKEYLYEAMLLMNFLRNDIDCDDYNAAKKTIAKLRKMEFDEASIIFYEHLMPPQFHEGYDPNEEYGNLFQPIDDG